MSWHIETINGEVKMSVKTLKEAKQFAIEYFKDNEIKFIDWKGESAVYILPERIKVWRILQEK